VESFHGTNGKSTGISGSKTDFYQHTDVLIFLDDSVHFTYRGIKNPSCKYICNIVVVKSKKNLWFYIVAQVIMYI